MTRYTGQFLEFYTFCFVLASAVTRQGIAKFDT